MSAKTGIEWTDSTWSPIRVRVRNDAAEIARQKGCASLIQIAEKMAGHVGQHCERYSDGCLHCWSERYQHRCLPGNGTGLPFDRRSRDLVEVFLDRRVLALPISWKETKKIFVEDQSDLFGEWVPEELIHHVFAVMKICTWHTFQILTKRATRMREYINSLYGNILGAPWRHVHLGVSCEDQKTADERIPLLLQTPATVRFVSAEPLLSEMELDADWIYPYCQECGRHSRRGNYTCDFPGCGDGNLRGSALIDWVICGGESGPGARPCNIGQVRNIVRQCADARVACFVKQLGSQPLMPREGDMPTHMILRDRKGGDINEFPEDLRVRQFPEVPRGIDCAAARYWAELAGRWREDRTAYIEQFCKRAIAKFPS